MSFCCLYMSELKAVKSWGYNCKWRHLSLLKCFQKGQKSPSVFQRCLTAWQIILKTNICARTPAVPKKRWLQNIPGVGAFWGRGSKYFLVGLQVYIVYIWGEVSDTCTSECQLWNAFKCQLRLLNIQYNIIQICVTIYHFFLHKKYVAALSFPAKSLFYL